MYHVDYVKKEIFLLQYILNITYKYRYLAYMLLQVTFIFRKVILKIPNWIKDNNTAKIHSSFTYIYIYI